MPKLKSVSKETLEDDRAFYARLVQSQGPRPVNVFELNDREILALIDRELAARDTEDDYGEP